MLKVELFIVILRYIVHNPDPGLKSKAFVPGPLAKVEPVFLRVNSGKILTYHLKY
jgi:hypothetical protein